MLFLEIRKKELKIILIEDKKFKIPKNLEESYKKDIHNIDNLIIFIEFVKELTSIMLHKFQNENLVEDFYELYSKMLDDYYYNTDKLLTNNENVIVENLEDNLSL